MGTAPGRRGSTLMVPRGPGWGCLCPAAACLNIRWHPLRAPAPRDGPSPRPLQAGPAQTTATRIPQSAWHLSSGPQVGGVSQRWPLPPGSQQEQGLGPSQQVAETEARFFSHVTKWKKSWLVPGRTGMDKPFGENTIPGKLATFFSRRMLEVLVARYGKRKPPYTEVIHGQWCGGVYTGQVVRAPLPP